MARRVCAECGPAGGPLFDPDFGGIHATVALLFATPGPAVSSGTTQPGTGFVSPDNPDPSAKRTNDVLVNAGIPRCDVVIWNAIPWYLPRKQDRTLNNGSAADQKLAAPLLFEFLSLCPRLNVLVLLGNIARDVARRAYRLDPGPFETLWVLSCPHTSQQSMNRKPDRPQRLQAAFDQAAELRREAAPLRTELISHAF